MPIYEYECTKCGCRTEVWQKISDPDVSKCENCRGKMRKLISQSSFHLKGTGWYVTDYKSGKDSDKRAPKAESKAETKPSEEKPKKEAAPAASKTTGE
jgi:putative FmdB family regulatory protein